MDIEFDPEKRDWTLRKRGLDMAKAEAIFTGFTMSREDNREDYGEIRVVTIGRLTRRKIVVCVWTERAGRRRIISLREAEPDEREIYLFQAP
ncbi:BrnT family toxin [Sphingomonas sp.]|uniref:BrnT family toxin n=1 Tax=Sphingomonas sp. TaxID=28214 RepID=UPI0025F05649|nr:BrnT family toxin [Sphingomonas sp.]MBV9528288.1 BrnT family toxin [Sphingomonas sp.]